jgi:hypothetical protein
VLLHAVNAILLWLILRRLQVPAAWLAAMVFALHPVFVESVAWVTERKNVLSGLFYFASAICLLRYLDLGRVQGNLGNLEKAAYHFSETLRIRPDHVAARRNLQLSMSLIEQRRHAEQRKMP